MSMDRKRYAAGLLAGLLVGFLVVVAGSQGAFIVNSGAIDLAPTGQVNQRSESTTILFMVTTTASTTSAPNQFKTPNATSASTSSTTANQGGVQAAQTSTSTRSTNFPSQTSGVFDAAALVPNPVPPSSLYSIVHQPVFSDIIVLLPLLLAFFLGALLYRLSRSKDKG